MRVRSIHVTLLQDWKLHAEFLLHCLFDFCVCRLFLFKELAARKADHLQATLLVPIVELYKLSVVAFCKGSLGGHIDDQSAFLPFHEVTQDELIQVQVSDDYRPEFPDKVALIPVIASLPRGPKTDASLSISHFRFVRRRAISFYIFGQIYIFESEEVVCLKKN